MMSSSISSSHRSSRISAFTFFEKLFCIYALLYFSQGMYTVLGNPALVQLMRYSVLLGSVLLLGMRWRTSFIAFQRGRLLWPLILWIMLSIAWSLYPEQTFDAIKGQVLPYTTFCIYFASRFSIREQLQLVAITLGITAFLSFVYAVAIPSVGKHVGDKFDGAWKGIYPEKNNFSGMTTVTLLVYLILNFYNRNRLEKRLAKLGLGFSVCLILLSTSMTGLLVFIALTGSILLFHKYRWQGGRTIFITDIVLLLLLVVSLSIFHNWFDIMQELGKDPTMSGRTTIWVGTWEKIHQSPWLGYGLEGFWQEGNPMAVEVGRVLHRDFVPSHAHNGFLDMLTDIGWIGFGLFAIGFFATFRIALKRAYRAACPEDFWPLSVIFLLLFYNITETWFLKQGNFFWVMYLTMFLSVRIWPQKPKLSYGTAPTNTVAQGPSPQTTLKKVPVGLLPR